MTKAAKWMVVVLCGVVMLSGLPWAAAIEGTPIKVRADVGATSTDNRDSADDAFEEDNVDIFVGGRFECLFDWEAALLDLYYAPRYRYRSDPSAIQNENEWHHQVNLIGEVSPLSRLTLRVQERFDYTDDPSVDQAGATLRRDSSYLMNRVDVLASLDVTKTLETSVDVGHMLKRYDENTVVDRADEDRLIVGVNARQQIAPTMSVLGRVAWQNYNLEDYVASDGSLMLPRGFDALQVGVGLEQVFSPKVIGSAMVGIQSSFYEDNALDDETLPFGTALLAATPAKTVRLRAQVSHMLVNAYAYPFTSQRLTSLYGKAMWDVTSMVELACTLQYRIEDYDRETVNPAVTNDAFAKDREGEENAFIGGLSATVKVTPSTAVQVAYSYENVDSDVFTTFNRNAGSVTVSQKF